MNESQGWWNNPDEELTVHVPITVFRSEVEEAFNSHGLALPENWKSLLSTYIENMDEFFSDEMGRTLGQAVDDLDQMGIQTFDVLSEDDDVS